MSESESQGEVPSDAPEQPRAPSAEPHRVRAHALRLWNSFSYQGRIVGLAATAIFALPLLLDLVYSDRRRMFGMVAADAFYYLVIGRNAGLHGAISFDGERLTNGFQPIWQAIVALLYAFRLPWTGGYGVLVYVILIGILCTVAALILLATSYRRKDGSLGPLFVTLPFGLYALAVCPKWLSYSAEALKAQNVYEGSEPLLGTLWSAVNGMETPMVILGYAALMAAALKWKPFARARDATLVGLLLAGLGLARLDHLVFSFALWLGLVLFASEKRNREWWRGFWKLTRAFVLPIALYLVVNAIVFGSMLPVSGRIKSSAPQLTLDNAAHSMELFNSYFGASPVRLYLSWRVYQLWLPAFAALLCPLVLLHIRLIEGELRLRIAGANPARARFLLATAFGVLMLAAYNFLFVSTINQGHWYFPISILFVSLLGLEAFERWWAGREGADETTALAERSLLGRTSKSPLALVALAILAAVGYLKLHRQADYHGGYADFYFDEAPAVRSSFPGKKPKLFCFDDGIVEFATDFPAMSATGLALDAQAARAKLAGKLEDLALARGFVNLTSATYVDFAGVTAASSSEELKRWSLGFDPFRSFANLPMKVAYRSERGNFAIVEVLSEQGNASTANALTTPSRARGLEVDIDHPGNDYSNTVVANLDNCKSKCAQDGVCKAFTFVASSLRCFLKNAVSGPVATIGVTSAVRKGLEPNTDRPGQDLRFFDLPVGAPELCQAECENEPACMAFTYLAHGLQTASPRCWLKSGVPSAAPSIGMASGIKGLTF